MKVSLDLLHQVPLDVSPPVVVRDDQEALKEWLWEHCKREILANVKLELYDSDDEKKETTLKRHYNEEEKEETARKRYRSDEEAKEHMKLPRRHRNEQEDKLNLLDKISQVQRQFLQSEGPKVVFGLLLEGLLELMDSEYGFIGEIKYEPDGTMFLQTHAITNIAWDVATRTFYEENADSGLKFYNLQSLFGTVMTTKQVVIANVPKGDPRACGVPPGHPPLNRFLGIPFFKKGGEMNGMVGVANKPGGYSQRDVEFLEPFTVTCSNLIQAYWQMQQNRHLINTLEQKVAERTLELELANENLEDVNRKLVRTSAAQLENFASMSHEIRTPLNCILGLSSLMQDSELNPMQAESLRMIVTSGDLLLTVVNDVLDFSKLESGNVDIEVLMSNLQETLDALVHSIEVKGQSKNLAFRTFYDTTLPEYVHTDSRRLQQILYNLLGNAIKFSKEGGTVELEVSICPTSHVEECSILATDETSDEKENSSVLETSMPVRNPQHGSKAENDVSAKCPFHRSSPDSSSSVAAAATNGNGSSCPFSNVLKSEARVLRFVVKDYGLGIKKQDLKRIFQPFHQASVDTERLYGGTGLGLAITTKLVTAMGGTISADSEEGEWAKFIVEFPFVDDCADPHDISMRLKNATVFLIHTEPEVIARFQAICYQYQVRTVNFQNMDEMDYCVKRNSSFGRDRHYICLVHEDLYRAEPYECLAATAKSVLLTFGPKFSVREARGHYRSLLHVIPSVLMQSFSAYMESLALPSQMAANDTSTSSVPISYADLKVLVAEDNIINQKVLLRMLKRLGVTRVDVVDNGQKAVDQEAREEYDIVLMDMQMPVMDGIDACRLIVERHDERPKPKVVFVTAHVENSYKLEAARAGSSRYLSKPFNIKEIEKCFQMLELGSCPANTIFPS